MSLLSQILSVTNLRLTYSRVVGNKGSSGVDGMEVGDLKTYLQEHWHQIKDQLEQGSYYPVAVLGIELPKANGGTRLLGVPTVVDRLIQQAIHQVLSPLWEEDFSEYSYGFRPGRNAHQAVKQAQIYINEGYQDIVDLDLKKFFDEVNHDLLMSLLRRKVKDRRVLRLILRYLRSDLQLNGQCISRSKGTPQGGPLSPLLSNILLHELDQELERRGLRFVRYADDCSIYLRSNRSARRVKRSITKYLKERLHLAVNEEKTRICRPLTYEVLGYGFISRYRKGEKGKYNLRPSNASFERMKQKVRWITRKSIPISLSQRIIELNQLMRGWIHYFKLGKMWTKLRSLDRWIRTRLRCCIWKQWKKPNRRRRALIQLGIPEEEAYSWSRTRKGNWAVARSPIMKMTVTAERLAHRGYESFTDYYLQVVHGR